MQREKWRQEDTKHKESERKRNEEREAQMLELAVLVDDVFNHPEMKIHEQFHRLAAICFRDKHSRAWNVRGEWVDLTAESRQKVLGVVRRALDECVPTSIPDGDSFSSWTVDEAEAFTALLEDMSYTPTEEHVRKWLPSVFRVSSPPEEAVLTRCFGSTAVAAEDALLVELRRAVRSDRNRVHVIENLPVEYWTNRLSGEVLKLVCDDTVNAQSKADLLRLVGKHTPALADSIARQWMDSASDKHQVAAAADVLLRATNGAAIGGLEAAVQSGRLTLADMWSMFDFQDLKTTFGNWAASELGRLYSLIRSQYSPVTDPPWPSGETRCVGVADELRELRDAIVRLMLDRDNDADQIVLTGLCVKFSDLKPWIAQYRARTGVHAVLATRPRNLRGGPRPTLAQVVRLFEDNRYRLIRDSHDLRRVVVSELELIARDVRNHIDMLYDKPPRKTKAAKPSSPKRTASRKHLTESALQAYLHCRLRDRLANHVLDGEVRVFIDREVQLSLDQRFDHKIQANTIGGDPALVAVEIKWSDHDEAHTSLESQLGQRYLVEDDPKDGIYVLGCVDRPISKSSKKGRKRVKPRGPLKWKSALQKQAIKFNRKHPECTIEVVVMDLGLGSA